jgi:hypothetical protein
MVVAAQQAGGGTFPQLQTLCLALANGEC